MSGALEANASARDLSQPRLPGEPGVWILILGDMALFAIFFGVFSYYRSLDPAGYAVAQAQLNPSFGVLNTLLLLASSWFVAFGVHCARETQEAARNAAPCFALAGACGLGFAVVKFFEYGEKIAAGITLSTHDFFMYYYMFTGIHFFHVIVGMVVLLFLWRRARAGVRSSGELMFVESGASYWHMVDLLWIVLFSLLYLLR